MSERWPDPDGEAGGAGSVTVEAPAKINLYLRVLHRRADGFHELETLFQAISLADRVTVSLGDEPAVADRRTAPGPVELVVDGPDLGPVASNLAYRAARGFQDVAGLTAPVRIELTKRVPMGAGLGGGSSDAAAVLRCLTTLTGFEDDRALHRVATGLGSDVPFFLAGSPLALGRGRGEELTELEPLPRAGLVLALPEVHVSTGEAYAALAARRDAASVEVTHRRAAPWSAGIDGAPSAWRDVAEHAANDFEPVVGPRHPEIAESLEGLRVRGALVALLSGSGASSFGLFERHEDARAAATWLDGRHPWRFVVAETLTRMPLPEADAS